MRSLTARTAQLVAGVAMLAIAAPASASAQANSTLRLQSLEFATGQVDATSGSAVVALRWTVTDSNRAAQTIGGEVHIRMVGTAPGTFVGRAFQAEYIFGSTFPGDGFAQYVSGTPQRSTYTYDFVVPRYGYSKKATWVVTKFTAQDEFGSTLTVEGPALNDYDSTLTAKSIVDSTPASHGEISLFSNFSPVRPYAYVGDQPADVLYQMQVSDAESGFWRGTFRLAGPGGQSVAGDFEFTRIRGEPRCGFFGGGDPQSALCGVTVTLPANAAAGAWTLVAVTLVDNVGNQATTTEAGPTVTATSNAVISASGFTANPNPVNNWTQNVDVALSMTVTGAHQGVSEIQVDFLAFGGLCLQLSTTPTDQPDGTVSVPVRAFQGAASCEVQAIAIIDGAGNLALYGTNYGAPDPGLAITRLPNTTPPTATDVAVTPNALPRSQVGQTSVRVTMLVHAPLVPVNRYDLWVFDTAGDVATQQGGGIDADQNGLLTIFLFLPFDMAAGQYTIGFTITDASDLSTSYGTPWGEPMPGGPLNLTITPD